MKDRRTTFATASAVFVASVWLVHGLFNKLLHGSPRHLAIVQSVPGLSGATGEHVLMAVGVFEVAIAAWVLSGWMAPLCAATQTIALLSMNVVELAVARNLLLWPAGLIPLNLAFLALAWVAASGHRTPLLARLRRHPVPIAARLEHCLTLTYALPADVLRPLLPPGLALETDGDYGFVAVALVQTRSLRPTALPVACGQDFFLAGYRIFTRFNTPDGRSIRGLRILRSDANRASMVAGGNLLTHYNYRRCDAQLDATPDTLRVTIRTPDGAGDVAVTANLQTAALPAGSPFPSARAARRFAGPLPYTFDYERETHAIVAINGTRTNWRPALVTVDVARLGFFDRPEFTGHTPILAAAFYVKDVEYRWARGVRYPLPGTGDGRAA